MIADTVHKWRRKSNVTNGFILLATLAIVVASIQFYVAVGELTGQLERPRLLLATEQSSPTTQSIVLAEKATDEGVTLVCVMASLDSMEYELVGCVEMGDGDG